MCWLTLCPCSPVQSVCVVLLTRRDGNDTERRQGRERKEECFGRKEKKSSHSKSPNTQIKRNNSFLLFLLFSLTSPLFFLFFSLQKTTKHSKSTEMTDKKVVKAPSAKRQRVLEAQGDMDAKRELAIRLMEGNGVPQNHPKAVALLEDCVALGDADAMLMLAKCCAFGYGMEHDSERAESLISEAANKGNHEALCLKGLIYYWNGKDDIDLGSLSYLSEEHVEKYLCILPQEKYWRIRNEESLSLDEHFSMQRS